VVELCADEPLFTQVRTQAHQNLAEAYLYVSDLHAARKHIELALKLCPDSSVNALLTHRVMVELTYAKVLARLNEHEAIHAHAVAAEAYAARARTFTAATQAQLAIALSEAANGNVDVALTRLAKVREAIKPNDVSFRDLIEIELLATEISGRDEYVHYYYKKYLFSLAEFQRKGAIEQLAAAKARINLVFDDLPHDYGRSLSSQMLRPLYDEMEALASLAALREDATGEHSFRVGRLSRMLAISLGYTEAGAAIVEHAARLHDIGKLAAPDAVLIKRAKLSNAEVEVIRRHTFEGCQMLADMLYAVEASDRRIPADFSEYLRVAAEVAQNHHEWWDGTGYPRGISGAAIPEAARIVALADVFDELVHARPYKESYSKGESLEQINSLCGRQFDPRICEAFLSAVQSLPQAMEDSETDPSPFAAANRVIKRLVASTRVG
jgi:putative two-component system response regulator